MLIIAGLFLLSPLEAQETQKDTLFFKYDDKYINAFKEIPSHFYLDDSSGGNNGSFFFEEGEVKCNLNPKKVLLLKRFVRSSDFYDKNKKLKDEKLATFFNKYIIFLVKKNHKKIEYIQVKPGFEIE